MGPVLPHRNDNEPRRERHEHVLFYLNNLLYEPGQNLF